MVTGGRKEALSKSLRDSIQASLDHAEAEHRKELFRKRLELARSGLQSYHDKRIGDAVRSFLTYIKILESWKKVGDGALTPALFDIKEDAAELLLISGVYWDLAKLFDRSKESSLDFQHYLNQFVIFSKGMPFQTVSSESLRKYLRSEKAVHRESFKKAYAKLGGGACFVVSSLIDLIEPETLWTLRDFRDQRLARASGGRVLIRVYYRIGPIVAYLLDRSPDAFRKGVAAQVSRFALLSLRSSRFGSGETKNRGSQN